MHGLHSNTISQLSTPTLKPGHHLISQFFFTIPNFKFQNWMSFLSAFALGKLEENCAWLIINDRWRLCNRNFKRKGAKYNFHCPCVYKISSVSCISYMCCKDNVKLVVRRSEDKTPQERLCMTTHDPAMDAPPNVIYPCLSRISPRLMRDKG